MKRNVQKLIAAFVALAIPLIAWAATVDSSLTITLPSTMDHGVAGGTNHTIGATSTWVDIGSTHDKDYNAKARLWASLTVTNYAAVTSGVVRLYYAISSDATNYTTCNQDRYIDFTFDGSQTLVNSVPINLYGVKAIKGAGYESTSTGNGHTNAAMWVSYSKE